VVLSCMCWVISFAYLFLRSIQRILKYPPTRILNGDERQLLWKFRFSLMSEKRALTKFLRCVEWSDVQVNIWLFSLWNFTLCNLLHGWNDWNIDLPLFFLTFRFSFQYLKLLFGSSPCENHGVFIIWGREV
jgi:hypothetical protein